MKSALLIIDVQSVLFDPEPRPFEINEVIERINVLSRWTRSKHQPVIYIQHEQANSAIEFASDGWQLQAGLKTQTNDYFIRKTTPDSFLNTDLGDLLKSLQVEHLIVCGYASEFCVDTTIRRAASLGYSVELVADAHTTHDKPHASAETIRLHHNCTLPNITSFGVKIAAVNTAALIAQAAE
ncbi:MULTISPECIES: cysteine hydrolase family protein [unclassified Agarivorans]|uniref:cysteine hydrolase family protein n=1 Tax=unclassified Agarivorans TaxID=2636026 RepID=UPI003D7C4898